MNCSARRTSHSPRTFHRLISLSAPAVATVWPSGLNLMQCTLSSCPLSIMMGASRLDVRLEPGFTLAMARVLSCAPALFSTIPPPPSVRCFFADTTSSPDSAARFPSIVANLSHTADRQLFVCARPCVSSPRAIRGRD